LYPFNCLSLFVEPTVTLVSDHYGVVDRVLKHFLINQGGKYNLSSRTADLTLSDVAALTYLQNHTLEEALKDVDLSPYVLQKIIDFKATDLLTRLVGLISPEAFADFLRSFYTNHYGEVALDTLTAAMQEKFGIAFEPVLEKWASKEITSYRVQELKVERLQGGRGTFASFRIQNTGQYAGTVVYGSSFGYQMFTLQPGECKQVRVELFSNKLYLNLGISQNIPFVLEAEDKGIRGGKVVFTRDTAVGIWNVSPALFELKRNEIVVDNEDAGFRLHVPPSKWLRRQFFEEQPYLEAYKGIAPETKRWVKMFGGNYYGCFSRTVYMKTEGNGSFQAEWMAEVPAPGQYELFVWHPVMGGRLNTHYYTVSGEGLAAEEVEVPWGDGEWVSLGRFDLQKGESAIVLDDRAPKAKNDDKNSFFKSRIVADAVKWVKVE